MTMNTQEPDIFSKSLQAPQIRVHYERPKELVRILGKIWLLSVQSTHHFLSEKDREKLYPFVLEALKNIPFLLTISHDSEYLGFMGIEDRKIEMLFIHPSTRRMRLGTALVSHALKAFRVTHVDVNEENPDALVFYRKMGFTPFARSEYDDFGNNFPLLHLIFANNS